MGRRGLKLFACVGAVVDDQDQEVVLKELLQPMLLQVSQKSESLWKS